LESARDRLKELAISQPSVAPSQIIAKALDRTPVECIPALPSDEHMKRTIRNTRQPLGMKEPKSRDEIDLTEEQTLDKTGNTFLFRDSSDERRILIFATKENIKVISI